MRGIIIILLCLGLIGCATTYRKYRNFPNYDGYYHLKLQDDIFKVSFAGNQFTASSDVNNYALLRSAEVALQNGYKYFLILEKEAGNRVQTFTMPESYSAYTTGAPATIKGQVSTQHTTIYKTGGETFTDAYPRCHLTIKCFKDKPEITDTIIYDAEQVKSNLRNQYRLK